ncbi:hypothetical protein B8V81_1496 [Paenibacillus pasadenensis]|uniref:Uncharacterized protein n=1 Tax=Paenibacillus pasadenensis TaxID=217090 RepID=A0A2N5NAA8_9BACL|nr:hypothetical protein B8V81_1496 [Paenibacillus pasadenensis]
MDTTLIIAAKKCKSHVENVTIPPRNRGGPGRSGRVFPTLSAASLACPESGAPVLVPSGNKRRRNGRGADEERTRSGRGTDQERTRCG